MADIKTTEREFAGQVVSWLNNVISGGSYPFESVTSETSIKVSAKTTNFPDIQIWLNRKAGMGFCGWELKTPVTPIDDKALLENAAIKARAMNADYFVTWNIRDAAIWRTPNPNESVSNLHRLKTYPAIISVTTVEDLWVASKQELLKSRAREIFDDLSVIKRDGHCHLVDVDSTFFVHRLTEAVKTIAPHVHQSLVKKIGEDKKFREGLYAWATIQAIANYEDPSFYEKASRQAVYRLFGKIIFYLTLRRFYSDLPAMHIKDADQSKINGKLGEYFELARGIDYQAVFEEDFTDNIPIPASCFEPLSFLIEDLNRFSFSQMPQDVIGNVFEKLIPLEERHTLGQYFTREDLVDLINAFCIQTKGSKVLDPTCGTGTFLIRGYDRKNALGEKKHTALLSDIWGFDVAHFPAELATINLYRQNLSDYGNFPRVLSRDFFDLRPGDSFRFPPPKASDDKDFMIEEKLPVFDAAVGNFPYIRQELIERRIKGYKSKLANALSEGWEKKYPELFDKKSGNPKLSGQADIYAYLFFHTARFLKEKGGRMGIVTSNSWLDVAYGYELQRFFLKEFKIIAIIESRCEPWFEDAAINTVVTILERTPDKEDRDNHLVKFVKIKKRLKDLIPWDIKDNAAGRHSGLDKLVYKIESKGSEHHKIKGTKMECVLNGIATYEDDAFRVRAIKQAELLKDVEAAGKTVKWGQYLRAPQVYFDILEKCKDKLVPLKEVAEVRRGYTTGINEFFYLDEDKIKHWGIEEEFLKPVLKSPREAKGILLREKDVECKVFLCHETKADLRKQKKSGALKYIEWGENQKTSDGTSWSDVSTVAGRKLWYDLGERAIGKILVQKITSDRFFAPYNIDNAQIDCNLYDILPKENSHSYGLGIYLNSSLVALFRELISRVNLGEGATKTEGIDWKDILTPKKESLKLLSKEKSALEALQERPIKPIFGEVKMKDRQKLDSLVLEAIGLDPEKYLKPIYDGLCELVRERIDLPKMRTKGKKAKTEKDVEKLKEQVLNEALPNGPKKFPEEFVDSKYLKDAKEISVSAEPLRLGSYFMGRQELVSGGGFKYTAGSLEEAKFVVYSQKPDRYVVKIPKDKNKLLQAVTDYERYVKGLKAEFFKTFFSRTHDHNLAATLANTIMEEIGMKEI